jgi:YD repeat-containing protein
VTNRDLTFSVNGGLSAGMVDIQPNTKGSTNAVDGDAAGKGSSASDSGPSFSLGVSGSGGFSWTSPNASFDAGTYGNQISSLQRDFGADVAEIQRSLADVNGDGLPDSVYTGATGVFAYYNLGYGFTARAVQLGTGGFETRESATGGAGLGFSLPYGEFGGGVNVLWNYDWATFSWKDVNGDGILDQVRRASPTQVKIGFGTGSGVLPEIDYGDLYSVPVSPGIDGGQQMSFDRSSGIGGGVSATGYIGPLCLVACYLVIGGGGGYNNSRSSSSADLGDVNGDGFADALLSLNDDKLSVKLNQQGRTNLLKTVTNPMGGSFTVDYERAGNTVDHPDSIWVMNRVDIRDGRSTIGGHYASTVDYDGLHYDRTHRSSLGFNRVTITELDTETAGEPPMRINEQKFLNDNVFVRGLMFAATMYEPDGSGGRIDVRGSEVTWGLRDLRAIAPGFDAQAPAGLVVPSALGDVDTVASRGRSIAPLVVKHDEFWFDGDRIFPKSTTYGYDGLGNVIVERDLGAPDDAFDDLTTTIEYSKCTTAGVTGNGCLPESTPRQPLWSPGTCVNWASFPTKVTVHGVDAGGAVLLRERSSPTKMCDNGVPTVLDELVSNVAGTTTYATSDMTVNQYGDYELVMAPPNAGGVRYTVRYTYDADRHSDIAKVEEFDVTTDQAAAVLANGPNSDNSTAGISSSATFDPLSGRADSRTDANGAKRSYVFDEHGRIVLTTKMGTSDNPQLPSDPSAALITYEYNANDAAWGHAIARHVDPADGNDPAGQDDSIGHDTTATLDTITFVDGLGRVRQTKRDARLSVNGPAPVNTRQVSDGVEFDVLARPVVQYGPTADPGPATTFSPDAVSGVQTQTSWFSYDLRESVTEPGNRTTTYNYPWEQVNGAGPLFAFTDAIDPDGRLTRIAQDVRDVQRYHVDVPAPRKDSKGIEVVAPPAIETAYVVNSIGELLHVVDCDEAVDPEERDPCDPNSPGLATSYEYDLRGLNTRATTPNGGTVRYTHDLAGNKHTMVNDDMAALGLKTRYEYDFNRLVSIDHPGTVDDVTYEYGMDNSDGRFTAGRVSHITDRTHLADNTYDKNGAMVEQTSVIKRHNWKPTLTGDELLPFTYTTAWTYDDLGRITAVRYPDSKTVSYVPAEQSVENLASPAELPSLLVTADLRGELVSYGYDSGGLLRAVTGAEEGLRTSLEQILSVDALGNPLVIPISVPRLTTHRYAYLNDRVYDPRMLAVRDEMGNGTVSDYSFNADTRWLETKRTAKDLDPDPAITTPLEIQDLSYTYDLVGRPLTYQNALPAANRPINGGEIKQTFTYDGFGRLRTGSGTFDLNAGEQQRYSYTADFDESAPWSVTSKKQHAELVSGTGKKATTKVDDRRTYSFARDLGTGGGPLQVVSDALTVHGQPTKTYAYDYNANGDILSMLTPKAASPPPTTTTTTTTTAPPVPTTTTPPKGKPKPTTTTTATTAPAPTTTVPVASETNVWDRVFTWTLMNQLTSASDGSELRTFAYDDTGTLMIQDGNLLDRDGKVLAQSGGGPETIFLNPWVIVRSQKIYKYIRDGVDAIATKMDSGAAYEAKQMFIHTDLVGSTNAVSDEQGRGFQRHEYFPSGEIWIIDHKEEIRTPFQFGDGYYEDEFDIILFRARWYDSQRELFLSPDPLLSADVQSLIGQPSLGGAYTYAGRERGQQRRPVRSGVLRCAQPCRRQGTGSGRLRPRPDHADQRRRGRHREGEAEQSHQPAEEPGGREHDQGPQRADQDRPADGRGVDRGAVRVAQDVEAEGGRHGQPVPACR